MILLIILKQNETRPDAVPNTAIYTYGSGNRLLSDASATTTNTYAYDGAGRLTNHVVNGQTRTFAYNFQGRMTSLTDIDDNTFAYEFDGEGNRLSQSLNDCLSKRFVYDGADVLLELNPTNGVAYAWVNGPGIDQPIERLLFIDGAPRARRVFHTDALGSVAALTDPVGLVTQTYAYSAFGSLRSSSGPDLNRVTYTAREQLGDSQGWMYYRHRGYSPRIGRLTSADPWGFVDGANLFVYAANNAVHYIDPDGRAYFALRPLDGLPWLPGASHNPLDDYFNTEISHEQLFFEDECGGNIGFFSDGTLKAESDLTRYRKTRIGFDDTLMREAVKNVPLKPYHLLWQPSRNKEKFNCQDWCDDVRREYERLLKERMQDAY